MEFNRLDLIWSKDCRNSDGYRGGELLVVVSFSPVFFFGSISFFGGKF